MKKIITFMLICVIITTCKEREEEGEGIIIEHIIPNEEVTAFFEEYLPSSIHVFQECSFFAINDKSGDKCVMINSVDEFRKSFSCSSTTLPAIDFESYTLIIGHYTVMCICDYVIEQEIVVKSKKVILNLIWHCPDGAYASSGMMCYWGIYPKISNKNIIVEQKRIRI